MGNEYTVTGKPKPIGDATLRVTGQKIYVSDMELPGVLYARALLSTVPHARIKSIDTSAAEVLPGAKAVAIYKSTPQVRYDSAVRFIEHKLPDTKRISDDTMRFVGDRVVTVAAGSPGIAKKVVNLIKAEYEVLPVITDAEEAIGLEAQLIHEGGNIMGVSRVEAGNVDGVFQECDYAFEDRYATQAIHRAVIEPYVAVASFAPNGKLTVYSLCQNIFAFRVIISRTFGLSYNRIWMVAPAIGGAFGGKLGVTVEPVAAMLFRMTEKPVKVEYDRKENALSIRVHHASVNYVRTGFMKDRTLKVVDFKAYINTGAYVSGALSVSGVMFHKVFKAYRTDHMRFQCQPVCINTEIAGAMRGYNSPRVYFGRQRQMQRITDFLHMDMATLQMKNMMDPDSCDPIFHKPHGNPRPKDCLKRALGLISYEACLKKQEATRNQDIWIGAGLVLRVHDNSCIGAHWDVSTPMLKMNEDGSCIYYTGSHDIGTDILGMQIQTVSEVSGVSMDRIDCLVVDTDMIHWRIGDYPSRGVFMVGSTAKRTAGAMKRELQAGAVKLLETEPDDTELHRDRARSRKNKEKSASLHDVTVHCQSVSMKKLMVAGTYEAERGATSCEVYTAKVKVNILTGEVRSLEYAAAHDIDRAINLLMLRGQLVGAIQVGLDYGLCEDMTYDGDGKPLVQTLRKYEVLQASQMPKLYTDFVETPQGKPDDPYGAKTPGGCPVIPATPTVVNAICNAVHGEINKFPARPDRVPAALGDKQILYGAMRYTGKRGESMVKILGICGSSCRKSCYKALETALEAVKNAEKGVKVGLMEFRAKKANFCIHHNKCPRDKLDRCTVFRDDMTELYNKFYETDGVIIASPVYEMNITAQSYTFFDRLRSVWLKGVEDPDFSAHRVGAEITVGGTRNGGQKATMNSVTNFLLTQEMTVCTGGSGMYSDPMLWNPGDGSTEIEDPDGFRNHEIPGRGMAKISRTMKEARFQYLIT